MHKNINQIAEDCEENSDVKEQLINQLRDKNSEIDKLKQELSDTHQYLNDFVYAAAHALKSPVANLNLITILLEKTNDIEDSGS